MNRGPLTALVEKATFGDPASVLGRHVHVGRREEENLVGDLVDRAAQRERQPGREVDEALGVPVLDRKSVV